MTTPPEGLKPVKYTVREHLVPPSKEWTERFANSTFFGQIMEMPNIAALPETGFHGDLCKFNDVFHVYLEGKWLTLDEASKSVWDVQA